MQFDPSIVGILVLGVTLHVRAVRVLRRRGFRVRRLQIAAWHGGMLLMAIALLGPLDQLGERTLSGHMAQHLLIADLAAPLLLVGMRWPVHLFLLPRSALVVLARSPRLRTCFSVMTRPLVAIPIYVTVLYSWHINGLFVAAVESSFVHGLQHQSFVGASMLVWWSALEPHRRHMRGELWKVGHILGARLPGMMLGMAFIAIRVPVYTDAYGAGDRGSGLSAVADQQAAGAMMLTLDGMITFFALTLFFWRSAADDDRRREASAARAGR